MGSGTTKCWSKRTAVKSNNKSLFYAVQHLSNFIHDDPEIPDDRAKDPELEGERNKLEEERQRFRVEKVKEFKVETYKDTEGAILNAIERGLDPEKVLSEKQRSAVIRDTFDEIDNIIRKDERFLSTVRSMFKSAEQSGLNRDASAKIRLAYLARVKPLLSPVRQKVVAEYLPKGSQKQANGKRHIPSGGEGKSAPGKLDAKKIDFSKTSDMDILNDKVVFKK